ncbi:9929_t:CDS:2 [Entrophospora sp. SA101]|nr:276_t:CDS:2 [Entrophospora sp. SA101]CAJ0648048.1 9929_t:CDS:2 [Entrophospora sp. SA101]CAJ0837709.1 11999_t:CDS:2 [Entrophospora sp. SA101]CAJ0879794.1 5148_t:CDS:2 [Entrophospora sp. SA101]
MSKLYSVALDERIRIKCTTTALKHIDLKGGLDRYLLTMKDDKLEKAAELDVRLLDSGNN